MTNSELFALALPVFGGGTMLLIAGIAYYKITHSARRTAARSAVAAIDSPAPSKAVDLERSLSAVEVQLSSLEARALRSSPSHLSNADTRVNRAIGVVIDLMDTLRETIAREQSEEKRQPEKPKA